MSTFSESPASRSRKDVVVQRSFTCPYAGPMTCNLQVPFGEITVIADERTLQAEVAIEPAHEDDQVAADLIDKATSTAQDGELRLVVPEPQRIDHYGHSPVRSGHRVRAGTVVMGTGNVTVVNGQVITDGAAIEDGGAVRVMARVPKGSTLLASTTSAGVTVEGEMSRVTFRSTAGSLYLDQAERAAVHTLSGGVTAAVLRTLTTQTTSGNVLVEQLSELSVNTVSGDVDIAGLTGKRAQVNSTSGDISVRIAGSANVSAHTVSGDIRITAAPGAHASTDAASVSGRVLLPSQQ